MTSSEERLAGLPVRAGFQHLTLPVTMPVLAIRYSRRVEALEGR